MAEEDEIAIASPSTDELEQDLDQFEDSEKLIVGGEGDGAEDENEDDLQEQLKDSFSGSQHLKRLLEEDDGTTEPGKKKSRISPLHTEAEDKVCKQILARWGLSTDQGCRHVLDQLPKDELESLHKSNYMVDTSNFYKSPCDLLARHVAEAREKKMAGGGPLDTISNFRFRHKLGMEDDKKLRALTHKELRFFLVHFAAGSKVADVIAEAKKQEPEDDNQTISALPDNAGPTTIGRFCRLELIDPVADAAVFGDANLTFSVKLARHRKALGHVGRVIATTFEDLETLQERYKEIDDVIKTLEDHFAEVFHCVDCTRIGTNPSFQGLEGSLGAVYYNFPHSGAIQGFFDGHPVCNWRHENLMRLFFRALRTYVKPGGVVKVASNMGAVGVRFSYIVGGAIENEFTHVETMPFQEWNLHRYGRSYGDRRDSYKRPDAENNQSYNAQRADKDMVYCFQYNPSGKNLGPQFVRLPPTFETLKACADGPFKHLHGNSKINLAKQLHKRFITEIGGTHVG